MEKFVQYVYFCSINSCILLCNQEPGLQRALEKMLGPKGLKSYLYELYSIDMIHAFCNKAIERVFFKQTTIDESSKKMLIDIVCFPREAILIEIVSGLVNGFVDCVYEQSKPRERLIMGGCYSNIEQSVEDAVREFLSKESDDEKKERMFMETVLGGIL